MENKKIAYSSALSDLRGRMIAEIKELFGKVCVEAKNSPASSIRQKDKVVPLFLPSLHTRIFNDERVVSLFTFKNDDKIWVETDEDYYIWHELYTDDLQNIVDYLEYFVNRDSYNTMEKFVEYYNK